MHAGEVAVTPAGRVVLLNGAGSAGKTSIAKALQDIAADVFLHVAMDAFLDMLPAASLGHPDGVSFETTEDDGHPSVVISTGSAGERAFRGMRHAIAAMARQGNNLIVDDVMLHGQMAEYRRLLTDCALFTVGVFAPLDVLEARERQRGDRMIGLARWQYQRVHVGMRYDVEVDTSGSPPLACATLIKQRFGL